jgi:hypothetical protein
VVGERNPPPPRTPGLPVVDVIATWDVERSNPIIGSSTQTDRGGILKWSRDGNSVHVPIVRAVFVVQRREFSSPVMAENSSVVGGSGAPQSN